jgi:RNA polymerase sigma-70 factor (ECF subfamily)
VYAYHAAAMTDLVDASEAAWLDRFHAGDAATLEACYRDHFETVDASVGRLLRGADRETAVHEVFFKLIASPGLRAGFRGGSLAAWLTTVAKNLARDQLRSQARTGTVPLDEAGELAEPSSARFEEAAEARRLIDRFRREVLPEKWAGVFEARFLEQRDQRDAAARLGIARTTLAYQELRIRGLLKKFLLGGELP